MDKITCFDTAHYYFINRSLPVINSWVCVHLNGLDEDRY